MKVSKKNFERITDIERNLEKAKKYLDNNIIGFAQVQPGSPLGNTYTILNAACVKEGQENIRIISHEAGSEFCAFYAALRQIKHLIKDLEK